MYHFTMARIQNTDFSLLSWVLYPLDHDALPTSWRWIKYSSCEKLTANRLQRQWLPFPFSFSFSSFRFCATLPKNSCRSCARSRLIEFWRETCGNVAPKTNLARKKIWRQIFSGRDWTFFPLPIFWMHRTDDMKSLILTLKLLSASLQPKDGQDHFFMSKKKRKSERETERDSEWETERGRWESGSERER